MAKQVDNPLAEFSFDDKQWQRIIKKIDKKIEATKIFGFGGGKETQEFAGIISSVVYRDIINHFADTRGPDGPWADWSKTYADHLQKIGRSGNLILQFSGRLRQSFTPQNYRAVSGGVLFYNNAQTKGGFPYAKAHDEGGRKEGRPPKRKFMWLSNQAMADIVRQVKSWLAEDK